MATMSFSEAIMQCLRKYVGFSGRATRPEYWYWTLAMMAIVASLRVLTFLIPDIAEVLAVVEVLFALAVFLPTLAVTARRLHDIGKSGWWQLAWIIIVGMSVPIVVLGATLAFGLAFLSWWLGDSSFAAVGIVMLIVGLVPFAGTWLWVIAWLARPGDAGANSHGPDPRAA